MTLLWWKILSPLWALIVPRRGWRALFLHLITIVEDPLPLIVLVLVLLALELGIFMVKYV